MRLNIYKKISLTHPTMIVGFPGMGNVAIRAVNYLRRKLTLEPFAQIDASESMLPERILVEKGIADFPPMPRYIFYYKENPELIVFEGDIQLKGKESLLLIERILNFAKELRVRKIFTGAAFPIPIEHDAPSKIYAVANISSLRSSLVTNYHLKLIANGEIAGLNGLLLGYARDFKIPAACVLATIPLYATNLPNPKASKAIVKLLERILGIRISFAELDAQIREVERGMFELEQKILEQFKESSFYEENETGGKEVPPYIKKKIEHLFYEAKYDREKAYTLKRELDRWDLFELYEDRFLDLFKKS